MGANLGLAIVALGIAFALAPARASADNDSDLAPEKSWEFQQAVRAVERQKFEKAVALLEKALAQDSKDADVYNLLGFSHRKRGNYDGAFANCRKALALNAEHRGAHEYIGQAYLETGNLAKAREHLEHLENLDDLCFWGCDEYDDLKNAVEVFVALRRG